MVKSGDVVWFPPGETPTTAMAHIAIQESLDGKPVDWLEKVSDRQYATMTDVNDGISDEQDRNDARRTRGRHLSKGSFHLRNRAI